jgi:methionyl-tRNA synthetase
MAHKYITTTLPYVNSDPHIGFGVEVVQADALARYWRSIGHTVFFNTGTDEHGQKIAQKADDKGEARQAYVDHYAEEFKKLGVALNLSYDRFIRTTDAAHKTAAQELWKRCDAAGDIYKKKFSGLYCVGCESFKTESDLVDGKCPDHPTTPLEQVEEENYFFRFSKYQQYLETYLSRKGVIVPEWRRQEAIAFVQGGLTDFSISRERARLDWGVPVPGDDTQVMYVWFDALTNYISTLGWPSDAEGHYKAFWANGEPFQVAGKDQVRFQSIMWQAMLKSAGLAPTHSVFYHGFITSGGQKMSKSIGNVISPYELIARYGTDATRYLLLRHVHPVEDTDVTWERLDEWYNAHLANGIGNLVSRVMKMAEDNLEAPVSVDSQPLEETFKTKLDTYRFDEAFDLIFEHAAKGDLHIQETQPFRMFKSEDAAVVTEGKAIVEKLVRHIYRIAEHLAPFMPETAEKIMAAVHTNKKPDTLFARIDA